VLRCAVQNAVDVLSGRECSSIVNSDVLPEVIQCDFQLKDGTHLTTPTAPGIGIEFTRAGDVTAFRRNISCQTLLRSGHVPLINSLPFDFDQRYSHVPTFAS
jgi:hypothetical protein